MIKDLLLKQDEDEIVDFDIDNTCPQIQILDMKKKRSSSMSSIINIKIEDEQMKNNSNDYYGKNFHENFKDFTYSNPVIRRRRVM